MSTGSGGGPQFAPNVFQPPNQAGQAQNLQNIFQPFIDQSLQGLGTIGGIGAPSSLAYPGIVSSAFNQFNNPYGPNMLSAANQAGEVFTQDVIPFALQSGNLAQQAIPYAQAGAGYLANLGNAAANAYPGVLSAMNSPNYAAGGAAGLQALNAAFDPQSALKSQLQGQTLDAANVANAISGTGSSPYGASIAANALGNFDINWENQRLARMGQGISDVLQPANAAVEAQLRGASALGGLANATQAGYGGATNLLGTGQGLLSNAANTMTNTATGINTFGGLPYSGFQTLTGNQLGAMQNLQALGNQGYLLPQQTVSDLAQYLNLGINASNIAGSNAGINNTIGQTNFGQLASGLGGGSQLLFGNSLGNSGGLLGLSGLSGLGGGIAPFTGAGNLTGAAALPGFDTLGGTVGMGALGGDFGGGGDIAAALSPLSFLGS